MCKTHLKRKLPAAIFLICLLFKLVTESNPAISAENVLNPQPELQSKLKVRPFGITQRKPWLNSKITGRPEPPLPFVAKRRYPHLSFRSPTVLTSAPGTNRLFIAEQHGKIFSIPNKLNCKQADLLLDVRELVDRYNKQQNADDQVTFVANYGLTFHPKFSENRFCYLCYVVRYSNNRRKQHPHGTRVVRLNVTRQDPPRVEVDSEIEIVSWLQGGHNGGCLKFGQDGKLYISTGDGAPAYPPDEHRAGQDVSNLLASILRIDVEHTSSSKPYTIPQDNPFVHLKGARGEVWAYGMRNPWKISFDRKTGDLWVGDVGWQLWEMVYQVNRGDNFGWSLVEGQQPVHTEWEQGPTPIVKAVAEIPHSEGASVTGGFVYRGAKFPELYGHYIFGDYVTRRIWHLSAQAGRPGKRQELVEPTVRIVGFAELHNGELLLLDYDNGTILELERNVKDTNQIPFPQKLSESGLFESAKDHIPAEGVIPFSIQAEMWADYATAERFLALPGNSSIGFYSKKERLPGSYFRSQLFYPKNAVLAKTLSLELKAGDPMSRKRIETQILHFNGLEWRGYSYRWNAEQNDALLVPASGATSTFRVVDQDYPGAVREQKWRFASRMECMRCHNAWAESTLAFNIAQINRDHQYGEVVDNQIRTFRHIGILNNRDQQPKTGQTFESLKPHLSAEYLPQLTNPFDASADISQRGRSYLQANCAHCHRQHGGGAARIHIAFETPLEKSEALATRPTQGTFGIHQAEIIAPGDPLRSVLYFRMTKSGPGHMPHIGSTITDKRGLTLIHDWIRSLPPKTSLHEKMKMLVKLDDTEVLHQEQVELHEKADLQARHFAELDNRKSVSNKDRRQANHLLDLEKQKLSADRLTQRKKLIDELTGSPEGALLLAKACRQSDVSLITRDFAVQVATAHPNKIIGEIFESFLPDSKRIKRLGDTINARSLLAMAGDPQRGKQLFLKTKGIACRNCHQVAGKGEKLGPDLTRIGKKLTKSQILENILQPSKTIDPKFRTWLIETDEGKVFSGLLVKKTAQDIVIRDTQRKEHRFKFSEVDNAIPQRKSLMPELLLKDMSAEQVADLLAWLSSLK